MVMTISPLAAWKQWIAGSMAPGGSLTLDDGAVRALKSGKSLLPSGVIAVSGAFEKGESLRLLDATGAVIGVVTSPSGVLMRSETVCQASRRGLGAGSMPMTLLEQRVDAWIEDERGAGR